MTRLVLAIRYLRKRVASTSCHDFGQIEWPPHPARVYMALVAAHGEDRPEDKATESAEVGALKWLAGLSPPVIAAADAEPRTAVVCHVPVNPDPNPQEKWGLITRTNKKEKAAQPLQGLSVGRVRQPRTFPSAHLEHDTVYVEWSDAHGLEVHRSALERICRRVTRIGHSSSLVQVWLADELPAGLPRWIPSDAGGRQLRVPCEGLLDELKRIHKMRCDGNDIRPVIGTWQTYRRADAYGHAPPGTVWTDELVVLRLSPKQRHHRWLSLPATLEVARRLREALIATAQQQRWMPLPEWVSGHKEDGSPSESPHVAIFPLAFVGREHADGHLLGVGLAVPADAEHAPPAQRRRFVRLVRQITELRLGRLGVWSLAELTWESPPWNLQSRAWTAWPDGARCWGSVTPVVFDRHPKARQRAEAERQAAAQVADGCERIGLPRPRVVEILPVSPHPGAPASHEFPRLRRKDGSERQHRHVRLWFDEPVCGPIAIGAGRYRGYGFCRPVRDGET